MLDRIDYNVERMAVDMKAADKDLTVATGYQKKSIKRKIILLLLLLVVGMIILLGLKLSSKSSSPSPVPAPAPVSPEDLPQPPRMLLRRWDGLQGVESVASTRRRETRDWRRRRKRRIWDLDEVGLSGL